MEDKEIVLKQIRNQFVTQIPRNQLVLDLLEHYNIPPQVSEEIISDSLRNGEISISNGRLSIGEPGKHWLDNHYRTNYMRSVIDVQTNSVKTKSPTDWNKRNAYVAVIIGVATIATSIILTKCNNTQQNATSPQQYDNQHK